MLREGDVIELKPGHEVYADVPEHFVYDNRKGVFNRTAHTEVKIGQSKHGFETDYLAGRYVVVKEATGGGGPSCDGGYPDGHHVWCEQMDNVEVKVDFYESGCFTAMIRDLTPIPGLKARRIWKIEEVRS